MTQQFRKATHLIISRVTRTERVARRAHCAARARRSRMPPLGVLDDAEALASLLGAREGAPEVAAFLERLARAVGASPSSAPDVRRFPPSCAYVNHRALGLSLCFEDGALDAIHAYAEGVDGFDGFRGVAPGGVRLAPRPGGGGSGGEVSTGRRLVETLGEPSGKGCVGGGVFMQYDHLGIKVDLAAADWESPDATARCVSVWEASTSEQ